ncbi:helix-turn-helix domain-containing protein [Brassicibacter mesophilus]|uniref:helix-turn-helix domain-containing protein n=1 Tax=Brassicibacter mesophilus TaxID=745119 RepID=UPI003D19E3DF
MVSIGDRISSLRKELNLNQKELADKVGLTEASLSRYENNLREPKAEIIARIAKVLGCSTDYLLGQTDIKEQIVSSKSDIYDYTKLYEYGIDYKTYKGFEDKILNKLIKENIIQEKEPISEEALDKIIKYGIDAAVEILKLKKERKK